MLKKKKERKEKENGDLYQSHDLMINKSDTGVGFYF
jgi:hypothetical protein